MYVEHPIESLWLQSCCCLPGKYNQGYDGRSPAEWRIVSRWRHGLLFWQGELSNEPTSLVWIERAPVNNATISAGASGDDPPLAPSFHQSMTTARSAKRYLRSFRPSICTRSRSVPLPSTSRIRSPTCRLA